MYVALSDSVSMQFSHIIEHSHRDWEATMLPNVFLNIFHTQNISHHVWKTVRTTLQSNIVLQSLGEGHELKTNLSHSVPCFSNLLPGIGERRNTKVWF